MFVELTKPLLANGGAEGDDVRAVKKALNRLGYYVPYEKVGITEIPDAALFDAIKKFQKDHGLPATGALRPDDDTVNALNAEAGKEPAGFYIWRTAGDEKVRPAHAAMGGTVRAWADAPDPGEDHNCRCWAKHLPAGIVDPPIEPVYPIETLLLALLPIGRLYQVWRAWALTRKTKWTLGKFKSAKRWGNQLKNRDWMPEQITETLKYGTKYKAPNKVNPGNTATRYEYKGRFVVQDDQTKEILQVSDEGFNPNEILDIRR